MRWEMIGALAGVLVIVFVIGRLWFALVEFLLGKVKRLFSRGKKQPAWHTITDEKNKEEL